MFRRSSVCRACKVCEAACVTLLAFAAGSFPEIATCRVQETLYGMLMILLQHTDAVRHPAVCSAASGLALPPMPAML